MYQGKYRYDLHVHTSNSSACARNTGAEMIDMYKSIGIDGIVVTDHFYMGNTSVPRELEWSEWCERFKGGYYSAKERGDEIGIDVFYGWEYSYAGTDFITLGLDNDWLTEHPEVKKLGIKEYLSLVRSSGGYVIQAHPFREAGYIPYIRLMPRFVDCIEIMNGGNNELQNEMAEIYAKKYDLDYSAGSDSHFTTWDHICGIETDERITTSGELIHVLRSRSAKVFSLIRDI